MDLVISAPALPTDNNSQTSAIFFQQSLVIPIWMLNGLVPVFRSQLVSNAADKAHLLTVLDQSEKLENLDVHLYWLLQQNLQKAPKYTHNKGFNH